jgi:hypothetical protein
MLRGAIRLVLLACDFWFAGSLVALLSDCCLSDAVAGLCVMGLAWGCFVVIILGPALVELMKWRDGMEMVQGMATKWPLGGDI